MQNNLRQKIMVMLKTIRLFKNWYLYPVVYFGLSKKMFVVFKTRSGLKLKLRVNSTDLMALTNVWLVQEYSKYDLVIDKEDIVIDIGGHIGLFSLFASQFCKKGKIFCFEPVSENYEMLLENLELNKIQNIIPFNLAVARKSARVRIFLNEDKAGHSMFVPNSQIIEIESISLKEIFDDNNIEKCGLIKIDCEGAEYEIIDSLPTEYFKKISNFIIEYHFAQKNLELLKNLKNKLSDLGFKLEIIEHDIDMGLLYAKNIRDRDH